VKKIDEPIYRTEEGRKLIELELSSLLQLFNTFDPSPFYEKDLDNDAEDYIVDTATDIGPGRPVKLVIYLPEAEVEKENREVTAAAIHNFFAFKKRETERDLRRTFRHGRMSLLIGMLFLALCVSARKLYSMFGFAGFWPEVFGEGLLIIGWVAMWRPIQIFLYDWWPIRQTIDVYRELETVPVDIRHRQ